MTITITRLSHQATTDDATAWLQDTARRIGLGFHPDTHGKSYVDENGARVLDEHGIRNLDHGMLVCNGLIDTYAVANEALAPLLADALREMGIKGGE